MSKTRKIFATLTMVAMATTVSLTAVSSANASHRHNHVGAAILGGVVGGIIGGAIAQQRGRETFPAPVRRRPVRGSHVAWCERRYRSYDRYTDTFMGFDGYEHYCNSPYVR